MTVKSSQWRSHLQTWWFPNFPLLFLRWSGQKCPQISETETPRVVHLFKFSCPCHGRGRLQAFVVVPLQPDGWCVQTLGRGTTPNRDADHARSHEDTGFEAAAHWVWERIGASCIVRVSCRKILGERTCASDNPVESIKSIIMLWLQPWNRGLLTSETSGLQLQVIPGVWKMAMFFFLHSDLPGSTDVWQVLVRNPRGERKSFPKVRLIEITKRVWGNRCWKQDIISSLRFKTKVKTNWIRRMARFCFQFRILENGMRTQIVLSFVQWWPAPQPGISLDDALAVFDGYDAAMDEPVMLLYEEIMAACPEAKFLLTIFDAESWFENFFEIAVLRASHRNATLPWAFWDSLEIAQKWDPGAAILRVPVQKTTTLAWKIITTTSSECKMLSHLSACGCTTGLTAGPRFHISWGPAFLKNRSPMKIPSNGGYRAGSQKIWKRPWVPRGKIEWPPNFTPSFWCKNMNY